MAEQETARRPRRIRVWDLPTRLFHWLLVALVATSVYTGWTGGLTEMDIHMVSGQLILCLVGFRVLWGFVGSRHARFSSFLRGPAAIRGYLRDARAGRGWSAGHNPLGALSVVAMLVVLAVQGSTGLFANDDIFTEGPLAAKVSKDTSDLLTFVHHLAADALLILLVLHLLAVFGYLIVKKDNLIMPMLSGRKDLPDGVEAADEPFVGLVRALAVAAIVGSIYWGLAAWL